MSLITKGFIMSFVFPILAMLSVPVTTNLPAPGGYTKTIVVDNRGACGGGRIAEMYQIRAKKEANSKKRELEKKGEVVRVLKLHPGIPMTSGKDVLILDARC